METAVYPNAQRAVVGYSALRACIPRYALVFGTACRYYGIAVLPCWMQNQG
jgi:hypothetical protein